MKTATIASHTGEEAPLTIDASGSLNLQFDHSWSFEGDGVDNCAIHQYLDDGFTVSVDDVGGDGTDAQVLQHDHVACPEAGDL